MKLIISNLFGTKKIELNNKKDIDEYNKIIRKYNDDYESLSEIMPNLFKDVIINGSIVIIVVCLIGYLLS